MQKNTGKSSHIEVRREDFIGGHHRIRKKYGSPPDIHRPVSIPFLIFFRIPVIQAFPKKYTLYGNLVFIRVF